MVIDASAAVAWSLPSQRTEAAMAFLQRSDSRFTAPWYFAVEFRNVMLRSEKRQLISRELGEAAVIDTMHLVSLAPPPSGATLDEVQRLARTQGLTHYDGHYLSLALDRDLPLATRDEALLKACSRLGLRAHDLRDSKPT